MKVNNLTISKKTNRNISIIFLLTLGLLLVSMPVGYSPEASSEGSLLIQVYPDMSMEVEFQSQGTTNITESFGISSLTMSYTSESVSEDLTDSEMTLTLLPSMEYLFLLAAMDFDITSHIEGHDYTSDIEIGIPGYGGIDGSISGSYDENTRLSTISVDANLTIWYTLLMSEMVEPMLDAFNESSLELANALETETQGNITFTELLLVDYEMGIENTRAWIQATVEGDFEKGANALTSSEYMDNITTTTPSLNLEGLTVVSSDAHIYFDKNDFNLKMSMSSRYQGDVDEWFNEYKNTVYQAVLENMNETDNIQPLGDLILNTEIGLRDANMSLEYSMGSNPEFSVETYELTLKPSNIPVLLETLQNASKGTPETGYNLIFVGATSGNQYVEINIPSETTEPTESEPSRVLWNFHNLEELDKVTFLVKEKESSDPGSSPIQLDYVIPAVGVAGLAIAAYLLLKRK